jgi:hypothetical protein
MLSIPKNAAIFLCGSSINMHNGFEGLSYAAYNFFGDQPPSDAYFIFVSPRRNNIKILHKKDQGSSIWYARSIKGSFASGNLVKTRITHKELRAILNAQTPKHLIIKNTS